MTLGLVMIVKNESERIEACLDAVKPYIDSYTIVDTGSTDDTIAKIYNTFPDGKLVVHESPFINFGHNRSEALALAKDTADWLLCLDADMIAEFTGITKEYFIRRNQTEAFMLETAPHPDIWSNRLPLLIRGDIAWKYVGAAHAYLAKVDGTPIVTAPSDAIYLHTEPRFTIEKGLRAIKMLEEDIAKSERPFTDPVNSRSLFYLGNSYKDIGQPEKAVIYYRYRSAMRPGAEETYVSLIRQGQLESWPNCIIAWIQAFEWRPWRLEAQYHLSQTLRDRHYFRLAYFYASQDTMPNPDTLFVDSFIADYGLKFERSISASRLGKHQEALMLCDELLGNERVPENVREAVVKNRKFSV